MSGILAAFSGLAILPRLTDQTALNSGVGGPRTATYNINTDGSVRDQSGALLETWLPGGSSAYYVRADLVSGTVGGTATGSWLSTASNRGWNVTATISGTRSAILTMRIAADAAGTRVLASANITIVADVA